MPLRREPKPFARSTRRCKADILCHLSDTAVRLNRPLKWDPAKERFLKDDEANRQLALRLMRDPWRLS